MPSTGMFDAKVVIVTGGGTGIGRALATAFHAQGAKVAIASRDPEHLKKAANVIAARGGPDASGDRLMPIRLDVRVGASAQVAVGQVADAWGGVDVLINNAGVSGQNPIDAQDA